MGVKGNGNSEGCHGAEVTGVYWGLLGAELKLLTGVREKFFPKLLKLLKLLNLPYPPFQPIISIKC